ncbi:MAG: hypothetical protein ACRELB_18330 [Polyangiaceae bacterium]
MNFVLHLHLGARDLGSPAAGAGAMLPDLWRMADRRVRARAAPFDAGADVAGPLAAVLSGIAHHLRVDRWFHADPVFTEGEREASRLVREAGVAAPRAVLLAHVLWELCLDGALVLRLGLGPTLDLLRAGIDALRPVAPRAAELHHFARVDRTAAEREIFTARLERILDELARGPWIDGYQTGAGVTARIQGVRRGLGLPPMEADDRARLAAVADSLLSRAPAAVARIERATLAAKA